MDKFNLDDRDIYYCGQESPGKERVALTSQQECSTWVQSQKWQSDFWSFPRQPIHYHSNTSLCPNTNAEEAELNGSIKTSKTFRTHNNKKGVLFILGDWNAKVRSKRYIANRVSLFHEHALVIVNILFPQHKRWLYTWKSPDGQYWNWIDYNFCSWRWRNSIQSAKTRL